MKKVSILVIMLSLAAFAPFASAKSLEQAYLESCRKDPGVPVPVAVVTPSVGSGYAGEVVELEFIVDKTGKPTALNVKSSTDDALAVAVTEAVKQWRFTPAERNGEPVATKVVLPVHFVDAPVAADGYAMKW
jgi:protein TonB